MKRAITPANRVRLTTATAGCDHRLSFSHWKRLADVINRQPQWGGATCGRLPADGGKCQALWPLAMDHWLWSHIRGWTASEEKGQSAGLELGHHIPLQVPCNKGLMAMKTCFFYLTGIRCVGKVRTLSGEYIQWNMLCVWPSKRVYYSLGGPFHKGAFRKLCVRI